MKQYTVNSTPAPQPIYHQYMKVIFLALTALFVIIQLRYIYRFMRIRSRSLILIQQQADEGRTGTTIESLTKELHKLEAREALLQADLMWPDQYLRVIAELIPADVRLISFSCSSDKPLELKGAARTNRALAEFIEVLKYRSTYKKVHIHRITYDAIQREAQFHITIDI